MKVAILGTGPSAAYAALACDQYNVECDILSKTSPPVFYAGAFWPRHLPTNNLLPLYRVYISRVGTAENYLQKQWGTVKDEWLEETSFPAGAEYENAYSPYELFGWIWQYRKIQLIPTLSDKDIAKLADDYDKIFMTFPTEKSKKTLGEYLVKFPIVSYLSNYKINHYCIYDGQNYDKIVRMSSLFGYIHNEYAPDHVPMPALVDNGNVTWAQDTHPDTPEWDLTDVPAENVMLVGRHAQWSRKVLSHHAFDIVYEELARMV